MNRVLSVAGFVATAIVASALFGVVHDQFTYSVSPEYFTEFKFVQFGLLESRAPERARVALVGALATWWMGVPLGLLVGLPLARHKSWRPVLRAYAWLPPIMISTTLVVGLLGLLFGYWSTRSIDLTNYVNWFVPEGLKNLRAYLCVGYMHNASYMGGILAVFAGWVSDGVLTRTRSDA